MKTILAALAAARAPLGPGFWRLLAPLAAAAGVAAAATAAGLAPLVAFLLGAAMGAGLGMVLAPAHEAAAEPPGGAEGEEDPRPAQPEQAARGILDALPAPLFVITAAGRVVHANPAALRTLPRLELGAHHANVIRAPEFVAAVAASLEDGTPRAVAFAASPGRERVLHARLSPLPPSGALAAEGGLIVVVEDRTEARRAEQLRSDFVANASHELRTPLASIIGYIETLEHHARDDPAAQARFLKIMGREAVRMKRLVDDLLSLSRIEMSEHVRPRDPCAITDVAAEAAAALAPVAEAEGAQLAIDLPQEGPIVPGDRDQLSQVFTNLIDNAIKYGGRDVRVRVRLAEPSSAFPGRVGIAVSDTGPGIAREHLPRLTERFYRANTGQSRRKGGTGLGLAIVKHILNRHEGRLEIVSIPGEGSTFTVWLPRGDSGSRPPEQVGGPEQPRDGMS